MAYEGGYTSGVNSLSEQDARAIYSLVTQAQNQRAAQRQQAEMQASQMQRQGANMAGNITPQIAPPPPPQNMPQPPMPGVNSAPPQAAPPPGGGGGGPQPPAAAPGGAPAIQPPPGVPPPPQHGPNWSPMPSPPPQAGGGAPAGPQQIEPPPEPEKQVEQLGALADEGRLAKASKLPDPATVMAQWKKEGYTGEQIMAGLDAYMGVYSKVQQQEVGQLKMQLKFQEDRRKWEHQWKLEHQADDRLAQGDRKNDIAETRETNRSEEARKRDERMEKRMNAVLAKAAEGKGTGGFEQTDVDYWADVMRKGGTLPPRLATTPGGKKLTADIMKAVARAPGASASDMLANQAEFMGEKAGQRTLGTRTANVEMAVQEAQNIIPIALQASEKVDRTKYPDLNKVILAYEKGTGDENVVRFGASVNALINVYSRAIAPTGTPTVHDKEHAREIIAAAYSKGQFKSVVDIMQDEMAAARKSPGQVKDSMREGFTGKEKPVARATPGPTVDQRGKPASGAPAAGTVEGGYRFKGGDPAKRESWEKV